MKQPRDVCPVLLLELSWLLPIFQGRFEAGLLLLLYYSSKLQADYQLTFYFRISDRQGYTIQCIWRGYKLVYLELVVSLYSYRGHRLELIHQDTSTVK